MRNPLCDAAPFLDSDAVTVSLRAKHACVRCVSDTVRHAVCHILLIVSFSTASDFSQEMQRLRIVKRFLARRNSLLFSSFDVGIQICWSTPTVAGRTIYYSKHKTQLPAICESMLCLCLLQFHQTQPAFSISSPAPVSIL